MITLIILMNCILNDIATCDLIFYFSDYVFTLLLLPCEQRFLSCMAFSVYEVICVACVSRSWFVLIRPVRNLCSKPLVISVEHAPD